MGLNLVFWNLFAPMTQCIHFLAPFNKNYFRREFEPVNCLYKESKAKIDNNSEVRGGI